MGLVSVLHRPFRQLTHSRTADHDIDECSGNQDISTGRGVFVEATAGTWMHGVASEHNWLYQWNFQLAQNVFVGMQQSETPYTQGNGANELAPSPWTINPYIDPTFEDCDQYDAQCRMAWYSIVTDCQDMYFYGSGFWTFFNNWNLCDGNCQTNGISVQGSSGLYWYGINVRNVENMLVDYQNPPVTQFNNPGGWGGIVGAYLAHSSETQSVLHDEI